jgi:hypothetical protein
MEASVKPTLPALAALCKTEASLWVANFPVLWRSRHEN